MRDSECVSSGSALTNQTNNDFAVLRNSDCGSRGHKRSRHKTPKWPVVLITGDSFGLPLELGGLLKDLGCSVFVSTDLEVLKNTSHTDPGVSIVNFASVQDANPKRVQALRDIYHKPVVCLLPYPTEQQIDQVSSLGADLLIFKPLCAEEFKSRIRLLLWEQSAQKTFRYRRSWGAGRVPQGQRAGQSGYLRR